MLKGYNNTLSNNSWQRGTLAISPADSIAYCTFKPSFRQYDEHNFEGVIRQHKKKIEKKAA